MMREKHFGAAIAAIVFSNTGYSQEGFRRYVDYSSASQVLSKTTFAKWAVGDSAYATPSHFCWNDNQLQLISIMKIAERYDWTANLKITRLTGGEIEIERELGERAESDDAQDLVNRIAIYTTCSEQLVRLSTSLEKVVLYRVQSIDGFSSLSDWAGSLAEADATIAKNESPGDGASPDGETMDWLVTEEKDEMTDQPNVQRLKLANDSVVGYHGNEWTPTLLLRCIRNTSSTVIILEDCLVNVRISVYYKFEEGAAVKERWSVFSNKKAFVFWNGSKSIRL